MARKVLFYTHAFGGGGAETVFGRLAEAFAAHGDDVIFAADYSGPTDVTDGPHLRHVLLGDGHAKSLNRLAGLLRRERPDASFSALGAQNLKHLAAALLAGRADRCVLGYHGFAQAEPKRLSQMFFQATPLVTRLAGRSICVSDSLLANVRHHWRASHARTLRIYNPLPPAAPQDRVRTDGPPTILGCGRLVAGKRFTDLVDAVAAMKRNEVRLVILGEGPERAAIEARIEELGLRGRVDLPGHVADPTSFYRRAACLAITSESESFGLTAAEALMHGVPVVSTDCGGPPEILDSGRYGRIVPIGDVTAFASALAQTLDDPGPDMPRRARAEIFGLESIHRHYADLIDSLTGPRVPGPPDSSA